MTWRRGEAAHRALEGVIACAAAAVIIAAVGGAARIALPGLAIPLRGVLRPALVAAFALAGKVVLGIRGTPRGEWLDRAAGAAFRLTVLTVLLSDLGLVLAHLVASCGGLDSSGYLNAARLFLSGSLTLYAPVARALPFADATAAAAPLGFVAAATPYFIAPRFPPGLPLVMAASALAGRTAPFLVAPALGTAAVGTLYVTAKRSADATTGALAAVMLATSPVFLYMALQPMSDVPATFWIVLVAFFLWRPAPRPLLAALAGGMAILTRPPLALTVAALAVTTAWPDRRRPVLFTLISGLFVVTLLALQHHLYGSALTSGYGSAHQLFTLSVLGGQLALYGKWFLSVEGPLVIGLFAAGAVANPRGAWRAALVFGATAAPYLVYAPRFEDWEILRFLLPAIPFVAIVCANGVVWLSRAGLHPARARIAATIVAAAVAAGSYAFLRGQHAFELATLELKYPMVGEWFDRNAPANAVAIASLHSGSLRYYSGRAVVRIDAVPEGMLSATVRALERAGYQAIAVLEQGDEFDELDRRARADASLVITPEARIRGVYVVRLSVR
jgi:hypothetical protein